ncbi:ion transporter [Streptococcus sp. 1643]|uniref:Ion transporter n=1 Tax=Streptococcus oralis subsp. oralis TaxID=1891914 RepID=A0A1X1GW53_STROR|nr:MULTISPECIES: ion transporter [Streptococcus]ORO50933.1 ion transporter [Streptococcus oralis subsp. oralis]QCZ57822.1 ion transporter [Streptococcus sp. 1643]
MKKTWTFSDYYDTIILLLALISVVLVIFGFMDVIDLHNPPYNIIDLMIWIVFIVDYLWRFFTSKEKFRFIIDNIFDLLAILPSNAIFTVFRLGRIFRLAKLTKLVKLTRLLRIIGLSGKLERKASRLLRTNGLLYILYVNVFIVFVGSSIFSVVEEKAFSDSLWWAIVTVTTVGYGDIIPASIFGKWLAVLLMLVGIGTIGMLTSSLTNFFVKDNPDDQIKLDKLQDELITQRLLLEKQSEKIEELHRIIQDLLEKK